MKKRTFFLIGTIVIVFTILLLTLLVNKKEKLNFGNPEILCYEARTTELMDDENDIGDTLDDGVTHFTEEDVSQHRQTSERNDRGNIESQNDNNMGNSEPEMTETNGCPDNDSYTTRKIEPLENIGEIYYKEPADEDVINDCDHIGYVKNQILVSGYIGCKDKNAMEKIASEIGARIVGYIELTNDYQLEFNEDKTIEDLERVICYLESHSFISSASLNYVSEMEEEYYSNDLMYCDGLYAEEIYENGEYKTIYKDGRGQNHSKVDSWDTIGGDNWGLEALNVPALWEHKSGFLPVRVGVYDTGFINPTSSDKIDDDIRYEYIFGNAGDRYPDIENDILNNMGKNKYDHGIGVTGILGATHDNGKGISGIPTDARIYAYEINGNAKESVMGEKYAYAILIGNRVKVINVSRGFDIDIKYRASTKEGTGVRNDIMRWANAIEENLKKFVDIGYDFVIVTSAGNDGECEIGI